MMSCRSGVRWSAIFDGYALLACTAFAQSISVDASHVAGTIRRLNDVDNGPLCQHGVVDLTLLPRAWHPERAAARCQLELWRRSRHGISVSGLECRSGAIEWIGEHVRETKLRR